MSVSAVESKPIISNESGQNLRKIYVDPFRLSSLTDYGQLLQKFFMEEAHRQSVLNKAETIISNGASPIEKEEAQAVKTRAEKSRYSGLIEVIDEKTGMNMKEHPLGLGIVGYDFAEGRAHALKMGWISK